jgi:predicted membrane-bound mannosyltransferase
MLIFVLAAGGFCAAQSDQPSLGDLAKKSRQEKKVVKVFSNDDVATVRPETSSQSAKSASSTAPAASEAAAKGPEKAKDKDTQKTAATSKDSPEVAELKQKLSSYKQEQDGWKKSAKKYEDLLANETSDFRRQMYQDALQGDRQNVEVFQSKIDQAQADLAKAEKSSSSSQ